MSERKFEHTIDLDAVVQVAADYEKVIQEAQRVINSTDDEDAIRIANLAADALGYQQRMFYSVLPEDVLEEFWDGLEAAMEPADSEV